MAFSEKQDVKNIDLNIDEKSKMVNTPNNTINKYWNISPTNKISKHKEPQLLALVLYKFDLFIIIIIYKNIVARLHIFWQMMLLGFKPETIVEVCHHAFSFWLYQMTQKMLDYENCISNMKEQRFQMEQSFKKFTINTEANINSLHNQNEGTMKTAFSIF